MKKLEGIYKLRDAAKSVGVPIKEIIRAIKKEHIPAPYHTIRDRIVLVDEDISNLIEHFQSIGRIK